MSACLMSLSLCHNKFFSTLITPLLLSSIGFFSHFLLFLLFHNIHVPFIHFIEVKWQHKILFHWSLKYLFRSMISLLKN